MVLHISQQADVVAASPLNVVVNIARVTKAALAK
jgi:hypothetical protein